MGFHAHMWPLSIIKMHTSSPGPYYKKHTRQTLTLKENSELINAEIGNFEFPVSEMLLRVGSINTS